MAPKDVPGFLADLRAREGSGIAVRALEFLFYVAGRAEEVLGSKWLSSILRLGYGLSPAKG
jgi:hypothetical protein